MNQTSKEERSSAETGEKRARAKENIVQSNTSPTQCGEVSVPRIVRCASSSIARQSSKVGAVCGSAARTVLCGGRSVMIVPTATPIRLFDHAVMDCIERQFEAVRNAELVKDVVQVILYGLLANEEFFADFFVVKALSDELNDFHFAVAEEWLITTRTGFGRCRKGIEHLGGRVAIEPNFTSMHAMYAFYEEIDGGFF